MVLWRLITADDSGVLLPPPTLSPSQQRASVVSTASSTWTLSSDSKYPSGPPTTLRSGLVPYAWDPSVDDQDDGDEVDSLHAIDVADKPISVFNPRSISNVGVLVILIGALLSLFIVLPVVTYVRNNSNNFFLDQTGNTIDSPQVDLHTRTLVDPDTPASALHRTGFDGLDYELVFSDEFNQDGRYFLAGDDPFWEAVDTWYWSTGDLEWYDARQVYTKNGSLHIRIDNVEEKNGLPYRSGMLQSWNKFCFTGGYIEVSLTLPGPNDETRGYVSL